MKDLEKKSRSGGERYWWLNEQKGGEACTPRPRPGSLCPHCQQGKLDYDSLFNLSCPVCGRVASAGAFT